MADEVQSAALRRERRRQKILQGSEERMKKITGYGNYEDPSNSTSYQNYADRDSLEDILRPNNTRPLYLGELPNAATGSTDSSTAQSSAPIIDNVEYCNNKHDRSPVNEQNLSSYPDTPTGQIGELKERVLAEENSAQGSVLTRDNSAAQAKDNVLDTFTKIRTVLMLVAGLLVRFSFEFSFGEEYVQSIINPFVALEIAIVGYQKAVGMDMGANVKGGIWLSTLVLAGIKTEIVYTYKTVMGVVTAAISDFAVFFFGFIALHIVL